MSVVDPLPAGAFTLTGKTQGPAVNLGRCRYAKSQMMYFHLDEIRDAAVKAGWHTEEDYKRLDSAYRELEDRCEGLHKDLTEALAKAAALEQAIGWKPAEKPKQVVHAKKPAAAK